MTVGHIPTAGNDRKTFRTFNFDEFSRTLIVVVQMVGDGLILTTLSYADRSPLVYSSCFCRCRFSFPYPTQPIQGKHPARAVAG
jgi:hypothetical protein